MTDELAVREEPVAVVGDGAIAPNSDKKWHDVIWEVRVEGGGHEQVFGPPGTPMNALQVFSIICDMMLRGQAGLVERITLRPVAFVE